MVVARRGWRKLVRISWRWTNVCGSTSNAGPKRSPRTRQRLVVEDPRSPPRRYQCLMTCIKGLETPKIVNEALYLSISQIASCEFHAPFSVWWTPSRSLSFHDRLIPPVHKYGTLLRSGLFFHVYSPLRRIVWNRINGRWIRRLELV